MAGYLSLLANHLWQSTVAAAAAALICFLLRNHAARARYWLWLAASLKFLVPFSVLVSLGARFDRPGTAAVATATAVEQISRSFAPLPTLLPVSPSAPPRWPLAVAAIWAVGAAMLLARWFLRWRELRRSTRGAAAETLAGGVLAVSTRARVEPGIFGVFRPVLMLPEGLRERLTSGEFEAIVAHEMHHLRRRDNLTAALHMLVETLFWFHPVVWWIGAKLVEERERACDEAVIAEGLDADVYATGILNVCRHYLESPIACAAGVTGADLKRRIGEIVAGRGTLRLTVARKALLAAAGAALAAIPMAIGLLRAQTLPPPPQYTYEVVTIHPSKPDAVNIRISPGPQGGLRGENVTPLTLLTFAYDLREFQFAEVPAWAKNTHYDLSFTPDRPEAKASPQMPRAEMESLFGRQRQRMQAVLRDRFGLVLRAETRQLPMYALTVGRGGARFGKSQEGAPGPSIRIGRGTLTGMSVGVSGLARALSNVLGRHVADETGLEGLYDFKLEWTPDSAAEVPGDPAKAVVADDSGPGASLVSALSEQLGLKLQSKKGPVPVLVVEKIERPGEN